MFSPVSSTMLTDSSRKQTIRRLGQLLHQAEQAESAVGRTHAFLSTGVPALDGLLPECGIPSGSIVEWLSDGPGGGVETLALTVAAHMTHENGGACIVIDAEGSFHPPATQWCLQPTSKTSGLDWMIVVHPTCDRDTLWALEQSLRCSGAAVVVCRLDRLHAHAWRRLKLAAESGGGVGLLLRSGEHRSQPSWADVRLQVETLPFDSRFGPKPSSGTDAFSTGRLLRIELIRCRSSACDGAVDLEIDDETGDVHLAPRLAAATDSLHPAGI